MSEEFHPDLHCSEHSENSDLSSGIDSGDMKASHYSYYPGSETTQSSNQSDEEEMESNPSPTEVVLHLNSTLNNTKVYPGVSAKWYERQHDLAVKNSAREKRQDASLIHNYE